MDLFQAPLLVLIKSATIMNDEAFLDIKREKKLSVFFFLFISYSAIITFTVVLLYIGAISLLYIFMSHVFFIFLKVSTKPFFNSNP
jgi:hypothetical protein